MNFQKLYKYKYAREIDLIHKKYCVYFKNMCLSLIIIIIRF